MKTNRIDRNVVFICDRVKNREGVNISSNNLEFTSNVYFNYIKEAIEELTPHSYYYNSPAEFIDNIQIHKNDIVLSAIWSGTNSRNRKSLISSICEAYNICYVGADTYVQSLCQDKALSKIYCKDYGIEIPKGILLPNLNNLEQIKMLNFPVIIKPNCEGSSIGISDKNIAYDYQEAEKVVKSIIHLFPPILVEEYIPGVEVAVCCAGVNNTFDIFEVVELILNGKEFLDKEVWGFESKKCGKAVVTRKVITDQVNLDIKDKVKKIYWSLGKVDYMRIDGRIKDNKFYLIELTPDCSLHPDCFMRLAFKHCGGSYKDMIATFLNNALISNKV